jgi:DNA-binding Xre family transcriptional regulator
MGFRNRQPRATRNKAAEQLQFNPQRMLAARGIIHPVAWGIKLGFTPQLASDISKGNNGSIKWSQLETMCTALNCTPNDLFKFENKYHNLPEGHALLSLQRAEQVQSLQVQVQHLSVEKLAALQAFLKEG